MGRLCPICEKSVQHVWSHLTRVHKISGPERALLLEAKQTSGQRSSPYPQTQHVEDRDCDRFQLLHPFTAIVAGMTGSGKTVWVQNLLQHAKQVINPPPQRIVWSYSHWQPAYDYMLTTVPGIEFVKGIPHDLDEDGYFDPRVNNVIVIDDQMAETSNDKRILNLFTKGSHHRNLSVIFLTQNLYFQGKIMRTLSLNAAYLILFKNPRDKLQIMTLGKQMYPGKTEQFIQKYESAVQEPFGYLFVDLKPNTLEECRLRTNVLPNDQVFNKSQSGGGQSEPLKDMADFFQRQNYLQSPILKSLQNLEDRMATILKEPSLPAEVKIKEYTQLYNRYLDLEHQLQQGTLQHKSTLETVQPLQTPPSITRSLPTYTRTPENVPSTSLTSDSGVASASKTRTPSLLERITSKIRTPSFEVSRAEVPSTPLITSTSSLDQPSSSSNFFSTPKTKSLPPPPEFLPTPPPSKEKPIRWINYQDSDKDQDIVENPPRRSQRLRAIAKSFPKWEKF